MNLHALLSLSPNKVYTAANLEEEEVLERALRLLVHARNGQANQHVRMGPHITRYFKAGNFKAGNFKAGNFKAGNFKAGNFKAGNFKDGNSSYRQK
ncbi:hypothetical protein MMC22_002670 [Lobaria immixta]|nr:hypothetical protein [Lobaria immixta]